jgi:hypothetical protein
MPNRRFDWHEHLKDVEKEYKAVHLAVARLAAEIVASPGLVADDEIRAYLRTADENLEGTYIVRLFAAFEAALRSYDRARHNDPSREQVASVLIDTTGGRRCQGISATVRQGAHEVRIVRNFWAHESDETPPPISIVDARHQLQLFLSWLPEEWG